MHCNQESKTAVTVNYLQEQCSMDKLKSRNAVCQHTLVCGTINEENMGVLPNYMLAIIQITDIDGGKRPFLAVELMKNQLFWWPVIMLTKHLILLRSY